MKLTRCPSCHGHIHLDTLVQDSSAKSLLATVAKLPAKLAGNLIAYIALFRPEKSDLNNARADKLIKEVLALSENQQALNAALEQTVQSIQAKRQQGTTQPLKNHNYLKQVLDTTKDKFFHPVNTAIKQERSHAEIKQPGHQYTKEQNQALFEATQAKYRGNK